MINFCQGFFDRRSLADAVTYGKALNSPENLRLSNYDNRAQTFFVSTSEAPRLHKVFIDQMPARIIAPRPGC